jgi:hypothetical protein
VTAQLVCCLDCGLDFDLATSLMGSENQCQDCWEADCNRSYWAARNHAVIARGIPDGVKEDIAFFLQAAGRKPFVSTGIHGGITRGYGGLDEYGFWQYPLPDLDSEAVS